MRIPGSVGEWESWTGLRFPDSGCYVVPGALVPVEIERERDEGVYVEPNVWMHHRIRRKATSSPACSTGRPVRANRRPRGRGRDRLRLGRDQAEKGGPPLPERPLEARLLPQRLVAASPRRATLCERAGLAAGHARQAPVAPEIEERL